MSRRQRKQSSSAGKGKGGRENIPALTITHKGQTLVTEEIWTSRIECMLIGSYGDQYSPNLKKRVVAKKAKPSSVGARDSKAPSGLVAGDLDKLQAKICKDSRKVIACVLSDAPGAQQTRSHYLEKIREFLVTCKTPAGNSSHVYRYTNY